MFYAMAYPLPIMGKRTNMKKIIHILADEENYTPAGLLMSFLLGLLIALLFFAIFL